MNIYIYDDEYSSYLPISVNVSKGFYNYITNVYNWDKKIPEQQNVIIYKEAQREYFCSLLREKRKEAKNENEKKLINKYIAEHDFRGSARDFFPKFEKEIKNLF